MGVVLIAGMAAMLICIFLGPKFIEYLRVREFGQNIREDGPQGHHTKAGTPTMGGLIVFASICVPYLVLSDRDAQSMAVFGVAMGCALTLCASSVWAADQVYFSSNISFLAPTGCRPDLGGKINACPNPTVLTG